MTTLRRILQLSASEAPGNESSSDQLMGSSGPKSPRKETKAESSPRIKKRGRPSESDRNPKEKQVRNKKHSSGVEKGDGIAKPPKTPTEGGSSSKPSFASAEKEEMALDSDTVDTAAISVEQSSPDAVKSEVQTQKEPDKAESEVAVKEEAGDEMEEEETGDLIRSASRSSIKKAGSSKAEEELETDKLQQVQSVQCDRCHKWRDAPAHMDTSTLPAQWYCEMNDWDPRFNSCEIPDADASGESVNKGKRKRTSVSESNVPTMTESNKNALNADKKKKTKPGRPSKKPGRSTSSGTSNVKPIVRQASILQPNASTTTAKAAHADEWVQCENCKKWRRLPAAYDSLPDKWYCDMNTWDKSRASCTAEEEKDTTQDLLGRADGSGGSKRKVTYRELIANHFKHLNRYESATNAFLNARYKASSLYVPRGVARKGAKRSSERAAQAASMNISTSVRRNKLVDVSAMVPLTTFRKIFNIEPMHFTKPSHGHNHHATNDDSDESPDAEHPERVHSLPLEDFENPSRMKIFKPWKRAGGWVGTLDYYCS